MNKLAFIKLANKDYNNDLSSSFSDKALKSLMSQNWEIFTNEKILVDPLSAIDFTDKIIENNVDCVIIFFETWTDPSIALTIVQELKHLPIAIWGFPMFEHKGLLEQTGSFVGLTVFSAALRRLKIMHDYIYGEPFDKEVMIQIEKFLKVSSALRKLKRTRIGLVGYSAMSIYSGTFDHLLLRGIIGPEVFQIDTYSLIKIAEEANENDYNEFIRKVSDYAIISKDVRQEILEKEGRLYFAIKKLIEINKLNSINIKCQYELSKEYGCIPCPALSLIAEEGIISGCEGDLLTTVSQIILHYLTNQIITYGDILNLKNKEVLFSACGFAPYSLAEEKNQAIIRDIDTIGFNGPISSLVLKKGLITYMRLGEEIGNFIMSFGTAEGIDSKLRQGRFPAVSFRIKGSEENFLKSMNAQHFALCYGDVTKELILLCQRLGINYFLVD